MLRLISPRNQEDTGTQLSRHVLLNELTTIHPTIKIHHHDDISLLITNKMLDVRFFKYIKHVLPSASRRCGENAPIGNCKMIVEPHHHLAIRIILRDHDNVWPKLIHAHPSTSSRKSA